MVMIRLATNKKEQCVHIDYFTELTDGRYQKRCPYEYTYKLQGPQNPSGCYCCDYHAAIQYISAKEQNIKLTLTHYITQEEWDERIAQQKLKARLEELHTMPYRDYLLTPEWRERRKHILERDGYHCQVCYSTERLNVHHRTYGRRGNEDDNDLITLCQDCHYIFHENGRLAQVDYE